MQNEPAGMFLRILAALLDLLVALIFTFAASTAIGDFTIAWGADPTTVAGRTFYGFNIGWKASLIGALAFLAFTSFCEFKYGRSWGKFLCNLKVVTEQGDASISLNQALTRNVLRLVDGIVLYLVGFVVALLSPLRQRIGDKAAGTIVVDLDRRREAADVF